ncbi:MAG: HAD-IB family hydrolase [Bacteroidota bacterium]
MNQVPQGNPITVAAFDFDGTLTHADSMFEFIRFRYGTVKLLLGIMGILPILVGLKLKLVGRQKAKEHLLSSFFKGQSQQSLFAAGKEFHEAYHSTLLRTRGINRVKWHQSQGHRCFLVTASLTWWTQPFANALGLELIATTPQLDERGNFTGHFAGKNCHGPEKVRRLQTVLADEEVMYTYAYGDTSGDREMLAWADEGTFKPFRK